MQRLLLVSLVLATLLSPCAVMVAHADAVFNGPGLQGGINQAATIQGPVQGSIRTVVTNLLAKVLNFLALAATVVVIIAGMYLIVGMGSDDSKNKAKTIILYTMIGLLVILFARLFVGFFTQGIAQSL
jgi:hypothetical protein